VVDHHNDLLLQILLLAPEQADEVAHARCQVRICVLEEFRHRLPQLERGLGEHHATLEQEGSQLVDYGRSTGDESIAYTMRLSRSPLSIQRASGSDRSRASAH
jgi:hypothetical protein